jgi:Arc/MetJ-type ribon-helix-helix transcriptional regulator
LFYGSSRPTPIPNRYHYGMSKQIAVRLSDELVDFLDAIVANGDERSRAAVVTRALERERRRMTAAQDAEILAESGPDTDLEALAGHVAGGPVDL